MKLSCVYTSMREKCMIVHIRNNIVVGSGIEIIMLKICFLQKQTSTASLVHASLAL